MEAVVHRSYFSVFKTVKDCKIGWWTSIILTVFFTNVNIHSVAINEFPKWQTLFHLQNFKYI